MSYQRRQCNEFMKLGMRGISILVASGDSGVAGPAGDDSKDGMNRCPVRFLVSMCSSDFASQQDVSRVERSSRLTSRPPAPVREPSAKLMRISDSLSRRKMDHGGLLTGFCRSDHCRCYFPPRRSFSSRGSRDCCHPLPLWR